jgi:hypothetical protein
VWLSLLGVGGCFFAAFAGLPCEPHQVAATRITLTTALNTFMTGRLVPAHH